MKVKVNRPNKTRQMGELVSAYRAIAEQQDVFKTEREELRSKIMPLVEQTGNRNDKGDIISPVGDFLVINQRRVSKKLNEERATALLKKKGLLSRCQKTLVYIDEGELARLVEEGKLSVADLQRCIDESENYALVVVPKNAGEVRHES